MGEHTGRLLVVDDNKVSRLLLERTLALQGHSVAVVEDGQAALDVLRGGERCDLVLLDIEMPRMNGFEVLAELKDDPMLRDLPVIVASSLEGLDNVVRCIELGADDYLAKPVNAVLLRARIGAMLEKKFLRDQQAEMIQRLATPEVAADLQASGFAIGGQRIEVSVAFVDIRGFTSLSEQLTAEETIELLNDYYTLTFDAITSNCGLVNQIIGDGLMAVFGAPRPLEDHARCAVLAALEMVDVIGMFAEARAAAGQAGIRIGIGVATGEVIAGYTGTSRRAIYTCIGDTVNLAARLERYTKEAQRSIVLDGATKRAVEKHFDLESLGSVVVRGRSQPADVYAVDA
jgi:adenylate cyclase